jgi:hypothetical protein
MEVAAVLKCGLGLHIDEVMLIGGPDILVLFTKVCLKHQVLREI